MPDHTRLRELLSRDREALGAAETTLTETRWRLAQVEGQYDAAVGSGDPAAISRAAGLRDDAVRRHEEAVGHAASLREQGFLHLSDAVERLRDEIRRSGEVELGVDSQLPIALLPVRLETRFAGTDDQPVLQVRIYPDDVHVDDHEPALSPEEDAAARDYWTAVSSGGSEPQAWAVLAERFGPHRALWLRGRLHPVDTADPPAFPAVDLRPTGTSRPATARALPDLFLVRVRAGSTWSHIEVGSTVADGLQVGPDLAGVTPPSTSEVADPTVLSADEVLDLGVQTRWLTDFTAAKAAGMAVEVTLPRGTREVRDVTVAGVSLSLTPEDAGALVQDLVTTHRVTRGAGFIPPGTPTNNLADSTSGWASRVDPARLDPTTRPVAGPDSDAGVLARALGLDREALAGLVGAEARTAAESVSMARALFEATWGPYLRHQAQPGFPLARLPQFHAHATTWVRGGGPFPAVRLGRQPYGVLPVQPAGPWKPAGDDELTMWLAAFLRRVRPLWLSGRDDVPQGVAAYSHEPVSSRFRVRTVNASMAGPLLADLGLAGTSGVDSGVQERRIVAELGLGAVVPMVSLQLFAPGTVDLWLPMSDEHDLEFSLVAPDPKQATSVLGLLLRNACLQMSEDIADQLITPVDDLQVQGLLSQPKHVFELAQLGGVAVSATADVAVQDSAPLSDKLRQVVRNDAGAQVTVQDAIRGVLDEPVAAALDRYWHLDAFRSFRDAHPELAAIPPERRARLAGEVLDCASHRYDAWVTSLATRRLAHLRSRRPTGLQLGAWGVVQGVRRRDAPTVADRPDLPAGTSRDPANRGFVLAPSLQHAEVAGVLRAAWLAHGGRGDDAEAPFAVDLRSERLRQALALADGMRNGQQLGALLGYLLERDLHESSGGGTEVDWAVFTLRRLFPLRVDSAEDAGLAGERLAVDGWRTAQRVMRDAEQGGPTLIDAVMDECPSGLDRARARSAVQTSLARIVGALDGLMDLGLAESVHQLAGANFARAAAATDMLGRAEVPPDAFDVAATPRGGQGIEQRLVVTASGLRRPPGWATSSPRARLAPEADAFVARRLGRPAGIEVRLLDGSGAEVGRCSVPDLTVSALDLAADAASQHDASPFPLLLDRARRAVGSDLGDLVLGLDPDVDRALVDLLEHAARWHEALAARRPLSAATLHPRGVGVPPGTPEAPSDGGALATVLASADTLESAPLDPEALAYWGFDPRLGAAELEISRARRLQEARAATDAESAATALFGGRCVVTGTATVTDPPWAADQTELGVTRGQVAGWVQDTGRVRDAARALDEALLHGELRRQKVVGLRAGQTPALAGRLAVGASDQDVAVARRWVGTGLPAGLGSEPVVSFVAVHDDQPPAPGRVVGIELDAWVEVVPEADGAGAVAANLASPDSRAPNTILLAVPADIDQPWTRDSLFSVIDEALELAECRMVDLDASRRVPGLLPAIYISEYDDDRPRYRDLVSQLDHMPSRFLAKGTDL
jgi:hypothetical protein